MPDANLTPEQDAAVRDLLAEARHDEPMPEDVAARLDRVLAQLSEGDDALDPAVVVELASRRRHRAATLLVAAAAIVAVGVGLGQVVDRSGTQADSPSSATADGGAVEAPATTDLLRAVPAERAARLGDRLMTVRSHRFAPDVRRAGLLAGVRVYATSDSTTVPLGSAETNDERSSAGDAPTAAGTSGSNKDTSTSDNAGAPVAGSALAPFDCAPGPYGPGRLVAVRYRGEPAVLAFRRPTGDTRIVDLLACGTAEVLRTVTLPR